MVLPCDAGHDLFHLVAVYAVLVGIGRGEQRKGSRSGQRGLGAVAGQGRTDKTRHAIVFELLDTNGHDHVVGPRRDGIRGIPEGFRTSGTHVLDPSHRLVVDLQGAAERKP